MHEIADTFPFEAWSEGQSTLESSELKHACGMDISAIAMNAFKRSAECKSGREIFPPELKWIKMRHLFILFPFEYNVSLIALLIEQNN